MDGGSVDFVGSKNRFLGISLRSYPTDPKRREDLALTIKINNQLMKMVSRYPSTAFVNELLRLNGIDRSRGERLQFC